MRLSVGWQNGKFVRVSGGEPWNHRSAGEVGDVLLRKHVPNGIDSAGVLGLAPPVAIHDLALLGFPTMHTIQVL